MMKLTTQHAVKVLEVVDAGLSAGLGKPIPGQMCVEAAVCYALGLPHGDDPQCVGDAVRTAKITLNDCAWSSSAARARGLRRVALAQLGSDVLDQTEFATRLSQEIIRKMVPIALRAAASMRGCSAKHKAALESAAVECEKNPTKAASYAARAASYAASDAARAARAASYAASDAASYAARAASEYASYAARAASEYASDAASYAARAASEYASEAASEAARAASYAAGYAAGYAASEAASEAAGYAASEAAGYAASEAAGYAARDQVLSEMAEIMVQVLISMKSPGCKWLSLTEVV